LLVCRGARMEELEFGRCCVACMNRCVDDCRRDPAICSGAPGDAPRSAAGSASPSAGPPTSTWSLLIWSQPTGNNPPPFFTSPTIRSFPHGGRRPYVESMRRRGAAIPFGISGGLNAAEAEEGAVGCAGAAMPAGGASGTEAAEGSRRRSRPFPRPNRKLQPFYIPTTLESWLQVEPTRRGGGGGGKYGTNAPSILTATKAS